MNWSIIIQVLLIGVLLGGIYSLVSVGLTLLFGVVKVVNFAHGEFLMIGMYISYWMWQMFDGLDPLMSLFVVIPSLFFFGALIYWTLLRPVMERKDESKIALTVGISMIFQNLALIMFTGNYRVVHTTYSDNVIRTSSGITVGYPELIAFIAVILMSVGLGYFLIKTDTGKAMRAVAQDSEMAQLLGIDPDRTYAMAVSLAIAVTGACGSIIVSYLYVFPLVGSPFTLISFIIVIIGGLGNVKGAFVCGIIVGVTEAFGIYFISADSGVMLSFILLVLVLIFRPRGLLTKGHI
ncbi:MAG: branched-chain amino acid ABC transporter permease [Candidatus Atribacteria bacterium]